MMEYGVTSQGFAIKPLKDIIEAKLERARDMFGSDVDNRHTSSLRKLIDITSAEDQELWKAMERFYYANFVSTASGDALDLMGRDLGVPRRFNRAVGFVKFTLSNEEPGRQYHLPLGTVVETGGPVRQFRTFERVTLSEETKEGTVKIEALDRGPHGHVAATDINALNSDYVTWYLNLGTAVIDVENEDATDGGAVMETDDEYRDHLLGYPRALWTLDAVRHVVKYTDGVRDCRLFDPLGGTDVSLSIFKLFAFNQRKFGVQRLVGSPYHFDILIATWPGFLWEDSGGARGVHSRLEEAVKEVRPISIFPNLRRANNVDVGLRAKVLVKSGQDANGVIIAIKANLERRINALGLGSSVLYSDAICDCKAATGVIDVQGLHLRRCPPLYGRVSLGRYLSFQPDVIEMPVGQNIDLQPVEIAVFKVDSRLIEIEVSER